MTTRLDRLRHAMALATDDHPTIIDTDDIRAALAVCEAAAVELKADGDRQQEVEYWRLHYAVRALLAEAPDERPEAPANEPDVLATNSRTDGRRVWWSGGAWLYPGQSVAVIDAPAEAPANPVCGYRWLDHLCELPAGHPGNHRCGHLIDTSEGLSECAATPPAPQLEAPAREPAYPLLDCSQRCVACRHVDGAKTTAQWAECALHNRSMPSNAYCDDFAPAREPADPPVRDWYPDRKDGIDPRLIEAVERAYTEDPAAFADFGSAVKCPLAKVPADPPARTCATCHYLPTDTRLWPCCGCRDHSAWMPATAGEGGDK